MPFGHACISDAASTRRVIAHAPRAEARQLFTHAACQVTISPASRRLLIFSFSEDGIIMRGVIGQGRPPRLFADEVGFRLSSPCALPFYPMPPEERSTARLPKFFLSRILHLHVSSMQSGRFILHIDIFVAARGFHIDCFRGACYFFFLSRAGHITS